MNREKTERQNIGEGIHINFVENDRYKTNYISFYFVTPLTQKNASYNTLLSRVLVRGCEAYPTQMELNRALDGAFDAELDSDTAKVGEWHSLCLSLCLLDDSFCFDGVSATEQGIDILRSVLLHPYLPGGVFDGEYVESERKRNLDDIATLINQKARYARTRMMENMCGSEPYSICPLGTKRILKSVTPESLTEYYRELLSTARIEIFCVGRFDREKMTETVGEMFSSIPRQKVSLPSLTAKKSPKEIRHVTEEMDITQAHLVMGFRTGCTVYDDTWRAMSVYNSVLGGSLTSKLFCILREKMSLCYSVSSTADAMKGVMLIYAGIAPENQEVAMKEAFHQMEEIENGNITDEELENAKGAIIHAMNGLGDNPAVLAEWYLPRVLADRVKTPAQIADEVRAVTREDVVRVSKMIVPDTVYTLTAKEGKE